jgi:endonuclease/exonuclease/phosphatase family metal-dependent hydrolase
MNNTDREENASKAVIRYGDEVQLLLFAPGSGEERYLYYKEPVEDIQQYTITRPQEEDISGERLLKYKWKICPINQNDVGKPVQANDVVTLYNMTSNAYLDAKSGRDQTYHPGEGLTFANQNDPQKNSAQWKIEKVDQSQYQEVVEGDYLKLKTQWKSENGKDVYLKGETNPQEEKQRVFSFGKGRRENGCYWRVVKQKTILTEIDKKYQELGGSTGVLGSPCREEYDVADGRKRDFQNGSIHHRIIPAPLSFVVQNMGLLPKKLLELIPIDSFTYKGTNREQAIAFLMQKLRQEQPDVVGLCEVFDNEEKDRIQENLRDVYPYSLEGPNENNMYYNGGLLLLSKHEIVQHSQIVYLAASDWDRFTNKGVLYARIKVLDHPTEYNIFLTHTQDAEASAGAADVLRNQLTELANSIKEWRHPNAPTLLMGDLNVNGRDASFYNELLTRLENPENLLSRRVVTYDEKSSFASNTPPRPVNDSARHTQGQCLDYFLVSRGQPFRSSNEQKQVWSTYENTQVVVWQSSPDRDISDHYSLKTQQKEVNEIIATWK